MTPITWDGAWRTDQRATDWVRRGTVGPFRVSVWVARSTCDVRPWRWAVVFTRAAAAGFGWLDVDQHEAGLSSTLNDGKRAALAAATRIPDASEKRPVDFDLRMRISQPIISGPGSPGRKHRKP